MGLFHHKQTVYFYLLEEVKSQKKDIVEGLEKLGLNPEEVKEAAGIKKPCAYEPPCESDKFFLTSDGCCELKPEKKLTAKQQKLEMAKKYLKQYSYREVANWLTTNTGRSISHVGLRKRLDNEQRRKDKARSLRQWADYAKKAIAKAQEIEENRIGAKEAQVT